jgi:hypothetical protein
MNMKKFKQIIDLCTREFGERVLHTEIEQREHGCTLFVSIDASHESEDNAWYPSVEKGQLKLFESWSNTLNLFMHSSKKAHFYYQGYIRNGRNGKKYSDPFDEDGAEIEEDSVFSLEVNSPEEAVEWLRFIYQYRDGGMPEETKSIAVEELPTARWFEEPRLFLPGICESVVTLKQVQESIDVFGLPALYDKAYHLGGRSMEDIGDDPDKFTAEIRSMNKEGQAELEVIGNSIKALAGKSCETIQPGDFLVVIGGKGKPYTWSDYYADSERFTGMCFLVLRPSANNSYTALHDFLFCQMDGLDFIRRLRDPQEGMPTTMRFISDSVTQQQYALKKKIGFEKLRWKLEQFQQARMTPEESLRRIEEAGETLGRLMQHMIESE